MTAKRRADRRLLSLKGETFLDGRVTQYIGDVRAVLKSLPSDHFDCVVTSPPYWGLRDYGVAGQIGLERSLGEHLEVMVDVFNEVKRVMKPTATLWLNYGDCYASSVNGRSAADTKAAGNDDRTFRDKPFSTVGPIWRAGNPDKNGGNSNRNGVTVDSASMLKPKDLCMIPNRLAIALQEAGWWVRSEIIWHKPNPMPESITDRPTTSHEKIWLLTKSERYFYDADAIREPSEIRKLSSWDERKKVEPMRRGDPGRSGHVTTTATLASLDGRNARNVWTIGTAAFSEAHFATFPPALAERCVKAGSPAGGSVLDPFGGSGTTALVAARLGRTAALIELNGEYATMARARVEAAFMGKDEGSRHMVKQLGKTADAGPLFEFPSDEV